MSMEGACRRAAIPSVFFYRAFWQANSAIIEPLNRRPAYARKNLFAYKLHVVLVYLFAFLLSSICFIYIRYCNQRRNKFFLPKKEKHISDGFSKIQVFSVRFRCRFYTKLILGLFHFPKYYVLKFLSCI